MNIYKIQSPVLLLLLLLYISFYISRYHFSQLSRTSLNIISKKKTHKNFCYKFVFLMDSFTPFPPPPSPLDDKNLLSVTKFFCWCSLNSKIGRLLASYSCIVYSTYYCIIQLPVALALLIPIAILDCNVLDDHHHSLMLLLFFYSYLEQQRHTG